MIKLIDAWPTCCRCDRLSMRCLTRRAVARLGVCMGFMLLPPWTWAALYAEYRFEEASYNGTASEVLDSSGNGRHGKMVGAVTSVAAGKICRGIQIPQNTTAAAIQAFDTGIDVNSIGNIGSISFWYKSIDTGSSDHRMLFDATTVSNRQFYLYRDDHGSTIDLNFVINDANGTRTDAGETNVMSEATWTHIAVTWNVAGSGSHMKLYVNGVEEYDESFNGHGGLHTDIGTLFFGDNRSSIAPEALSANGYIDQIRIYNHEMTAAEITTDKNASPSCSASLHHVDVTTSTASVTAGSTVTFTMKACADATCSVLYTGGVTGNLSVTGTGLTVSYPSGAAWTIIAGSSTTTQTATITPAGTATVALASLTPAPSNTTKYFCGMGVAAASGNSCNLTVTAPALHHLEVTTANNAALTCSPVTFTIKACQNAACSSVYTGGMTGTLTVSGTGMTVNYAAGQTYTIASGSSTTTLSAQATKTGTATVALSSPSVVPSNSPAVFCGMNGVAAATANACTYSVDDSALLFNVLDHVSDVSQSVTVSAVRSSDNAAVCTPGFASVSKTVLFKCTYTNPTTGTKPLLVGGSALNATNNSAAACDGTGRGVSLSFDAAGVATTTFRYADVGRVGVTASYAGSGNDAGLSMTGNATFVAAPYKFDVAVTTASPLTAASNFNGTVTARNASNATTPNFGREISPEGVTLGFARAKPSGTGAVNGTFTGTVGAFTSGVATSTNLKWTEVGQGDVTALLTSGSYLSSGFNSAGSTGNVLNWTSCAAEGATCNLPAGATALVSYGANGLYKYASGQTGSLACTTAVFTDPIPGTSKSCAYIVTSGADTTVVGSAGEFRPHHLDLGVSDACSAFTYSGQPFGVVVTARNAASATTLNYDGSLSSSPAQNVTLSATANGGTGAPSNFSVLKSNFSAGIATVAASSTSPSFLFTLKQTAATAVGLRAVDANGISSNGYAEGSVALRSGQLKLANTFGSEKSSLSVPVHAQYWNGKAWVLNSADHCTTVPMAAVGRSNYLDHKGASTAAWTTMASSVVIAGGNGTLTLTAPSPAAIGTVDIAFNLGATTADNACLSTHASTTGANLSWLRSRNGHCAATFDRDPSARITFGAYAPETKRTIHVRELF